MSRSGLSDNDFFFILRTPCLVRTATICCCIFPVSDLFFSPSFFRPFVFFHIFVQPFLSRVRSSYFHMRLYLTRERDKVCDTNSFLSFVLSSVQSLVLAFFPVLTNWLRISCKDCSYQRLDGYSFYLVRLFPPIGNPTYIHILRHNLSFLCFSSYRFARNSIPLFTRPLDAPLLYRHVVESRKCVRASPSPLLFLSLTLSLPAFTLSFSSHTSFCLLSCCSTYFRLACTIPFICVTSERTYSYTYIHSHVHMLDSTHSRCHAPTHVRTRAGT